jgi:hypothetical protein
MRDRSRRYEVRVGLVCFAVGLVGAGLLAVGVARPDPFVRPTVPPGRVLIYSTEVQR